MSEGDVVHIVGDFDPAGRVTLSDSKNLLIVHPDLLISGTSVVSGIYCMRKYVCGLYDINVSNSVNLLNKHPNLFIRGRNSKCRGPGGLRA